MIRHIVNMSGGVCSAWAARRVVDRHGPEGVVLLFADVLIEDPDLYRFNTQVAEWIGIPITRISKELTPWQLFAKEGMIGNNRAPLCSVRLKREMLDKWSRENAMELTATIYVGLDWTEGGRVDALRSARPTWRIEAPMAEAPIWDKCKMLDELRKVGIEPPRLYALGFPHNNCGGFCVKAGHAQFALLLRKLPALYAWHEAEEEKCRQIVGDFSVMKDRRGGVSKTLTMKQFRDRVEAGESFDRDDWGGCGCAVDS